MKKLTPAQMLKFTTDLADRLDQMKKNAVFVGLPKEKIGGKVYGDGMTVIRIGAIHEFGYPPIPKRSFIREPFNTKRKEINQAIAKQYKAVSNGLDVKIALGRIGVIATGISKGAFTSLGYGDWEPITAETARRKGSTQTLIDTTILRGSISWVIRSNAGVA